MKMLGCGSSQKMQFVVTNKEEMRKEFYLKVLKKIIFGDFLTPKDREIFVAWKNYFNPVMHLFEHYKNKRVLFEIVKYLGNNELCLNENIRWLYCSKIDYLLYNLYFYKVLEHRGKNKKGESTEGLTFYCGLLEFAKRPQPPYNPKEKSKWQEEYWTGTEQYKKLAIGYNFGLDIDGKNFQEAYKDAKKVFNFFKKFSIKFSVWCSGKKGWHFIIPFEEFKPLVEPFELDLTIEFCKGLMLDLVKHLKLKDIDTLIYSPTRYLKCPYTIDMRNGNVIYPLSDEEFTNFNIEVMKTQYLLKQKSLGNRGVYINRSSNPKGFEEMLNYLGEKIK